MVEALCMVYEADLNTRSKFLQAVVKLFPELPKRKKRKRPARKRQAGIPEEIPEATADTAEEDHEWLLHNSPSERDSERLRSASCGVAAPPSRRTSRRGLW